MSRLPTKKGCADYSADTFQFLLESQDRIAAAESPESREFWTDSALIWSRQTEEWDKESQQDACEAQDFVMSNYLESRGLSPHLASEFETYEEMVEYCNEQEGCYD
jgi:hypothetical protein